MSEHDSCPYPFDKLQRQENALIRQELRDIFDPIAIEGAAAVREIAAKEPDFVRAIADSQPVITDIPYDRIYTRILMRLFDPGETPFLPSPDNQRQVNELLCRCEQRLRQAGVSSPELEIEVDIIKDLLAKADFLRGFQLDIPTWQRLSQQVRRHGLAGTRDIADYPGRIAPAEIAYDTAAFTSFVGVANPWIRERSKFLETIMVPVGEYGADFSADLARTAYTVQSLLDISADDMALDGLGLRHHDLLMDCAARFRSFHYGAAENHGHADAIMSTVMEGVVTITQTEILLAAEQVPGYWDSPSRLLEDIVAGRLPSEVAYTMPAGVVGPLVINGRYLKHPLTVVADVPELSSDFTEMGGTLRTETHKKIAESWERYRRITAQGFGTNKPHKGIVGLPCPALNGIDALSIAMRDVYQTITNLGH